MNTLLLDRTTWDLVLNTSGNIALASDPYSVEQDVSSACRLVLGELWYNTTKGTPYFQKIFGRNYPLPAFKALMIKAALTVPTVISAQCFITSFKNRVIQGQIQFKTLTGFSGVSFVGHSAPILTTADGSTDIMSSSGLLLTGAF